MFIIYQATRSILNISCIAYSLAVLSYGWANQGVTDWRFWGIKKLHELPEVLESQLKSSQKNLKNHINTLISSTTIKDSFKPEYYSVIQTQKTLAN